MLYYGDINPDMDMNNVNFIRLLASVDNKHFDYCFAVEAGNEEAATEAWIDFRLFVFSSFGRKLSKQEKENIIENLQCGVLHITADEFYERMRAN